MAQSDSAVAQRAVPPRLAHQFELLAAVGLAWARS